MCFPSHNSSQGKQFNLAEFSKSLLSICYIVILYINVECFLLSRVLESRIAVAVYFDKYTVGSIQKAL